MAIAGAHGEIRALLRAGGVEAEEVVRIVREIGIHLEDVVIAVVQGPFESGQIGRAQSLFPAPFKQVQPLRELRLKPFDDDGRPVGGTVVDDEDLEISGEGEHLPGDGFDVLLLVVSRDDDDFLVHFRISG